MSSLDNFKDISDEILSDIKVSDELKQRTLNKCSKRSEFKIRFISPTAVAVLLMVVSIPSLRMIGKGGNTGDTVTMMEALGGTEVGAGINTTKSGKNEYPDSSVSSDGTTLSSTQGSGEAQSSEPYEGTGQVIYRPGTEEEAKNYMGELFKKPEYIPNGFKQGLVQVPVDMDKEGMDVTLGYEGNNKLYSVTMRKGTSSLDYFTGNREIDINGSKAQISSGKLMAGSAEISPHFTQMRWLSNNVLYIIEGQISEEEAVKVAKSIK